MEDDGFQCGAVYIGGKQAAKVVPSVKVFDDL